MITKNVLPIVMEIQNVMTHLMNLIVVSRMINYLYQKSQLSMSINHLSSATIAPATINTIAVPQNTESINNEIERANVPQATTDLAEATLPQISIFDRDIVAPGVMMTYQRIY